MRVFISLRKTYYCKFYLRVMLTQKPSNLARPSSTLSRGLNVNVKVTSVEAWL